MGKFENKINDVFDFNILEEVENTEIITEGILGKAKEMAKKAISIGIDKVLPPEWLSFVQGLLAAYKQGGVDEAAGFLRSADQDKVQAVIKAAKSGALAQVAEDKDADEEPIIEQAEEVLGQAAEIGGWLSTGAYVGFGVIAIVGAIIGYKVLRAIIESVMAAQANAAKGKHRRR